VGSAAGLNSVGDSNAFFGVGVENLAFATAIGASNLQGFTLENHDLYARFRERKPDAIVGHAIFVFRISDAIEENEPRSDHPMN